MGESSKKMKKKMEHWEVVTMMLMVYDFLAVTVSVPCLIYRTH